MDNPDKPKPKREETEQKPKLVDRRTFIGAGLIAAAGLFLPKLFSGEQSNQKNQNTDDLFPRVQTTPATPKETITPELIERNLLSDIYSLPLDSLKRKEKEIALSKNAITLEQIDNALTAINYYQDNKENNWNEKVDLVNKRYKLRAEGKEKLTQIPKPLLKWAETEKMHPEAIGMVLDAYPEAKNIIEKQFRRSKEEFRPDLQHYINFKQLPKDFLDNLKPEDIMPYVGTIARLLCTETGIGVQGTLSDGSKDIITIPLINTGKYPAITQLSNNKNTNLEKNISALEEVCGLESKRLGVIVDCKLFPGSQAGAINNQLMPIEIKRIMNTYSEVGETYIPLGPKSIAGMIVWLSQGLMTHEGPRHGYIRDKLVSVGQNLLPFIRKYTFLKWNQDENQAARITKSTVSYFENIISKGLSSY